MRKLCRSISFSLSLNSLSTYLCQPAFLGSLLLNFIFSLPLLLSLLYPATEGYKPRFWFYSKQHEKISKCGFLWVFFLIILKRRFTSILTSVFNTTSLWLGAGKPDWVGEGMKQSQAAKIQGRKLQFPAFAQTANLAMGPGVLHSYGSEALGVLNIHAHGSLSARFIHLGGFSSPYFSPFPEVVRLFLFVCCGTGEAMGQHGGQAACPRTLSSVSPHLTFAPPEEVVKPRIQIKLPLAL